MNEPVRGGEPELAINPLDPDNLLLGHTVVGNSYTHNTPADMLRAVDGGVQASLDGGKTWTTDKALGPLHFSEGPNSLLLSMGHTNATGFTLAQNGVGDPIEASGPDGSLYAGGVIAHAVSGGPPPFSFTVDQGAIVVSRSTDGGRTFHPNSSVLSDLELQGMINRGMHPSVGGFGVNPFDRPWMSVDQSTGDVYVSTTAHPERYLVVSHDKARTWGRVEALDCDELTPPDAEHHVVCGVYPESGGGGIAAARGIVAATYISSAAPGRTCPCAVFETSTDAGAHWRRHVAFDNLPAGSNVFVAADPTHRGRYAVLLLPGHLVPGGLAGLAAARNVPQDVEVVTTFDSGRRWTRPTILGNEPLAHITNRPWIAYGSTGQGRRHGSASVLAVLWRNASPPFNPASFLVPGTQNVFAAISRDNGESFSAPVRLNSKPSPPPDPTQLAEDDVSWVAVTTHALYGAWGDWRPTANNPIAPGSFPPSGELNAWIARVPLGRFDADQ